MGDKARTLGLLLAAGGGYAAWQHLPLEQALNALIAAMVFNIGYDLLLRCAAVVVRRWCGAVPWCGALVWCCVGRASERAREDAAADDDVSVAGRPFLADPVSL